MGLTLSCPGAGLPVLPGNPALGALREFRERLPGCLTARADALRRLSAELDEQPPATEAAADVDDQDETADGDGAAG